jgi:hypothetical protein
LLERASTGTILASHFSTHLHQGMNYEAPWILIMWELLLLAISFDQNQFYSD